MEQSAIYPLPTISRFTRNEPNPCLAPKSSNGLPGLSYHTTRRSTPRGPSELNRGKEEITSNIHRPHTHTRDTCTQSIHTIINKNIIDKITHYSLTPYFHQLPQHFQFNVLTKVPLLSNKSTAASKSQFQSDLFYSVLSFLSFPTLLPPRRLCFHPALSPATASFLSLLPASSTTARCSLPHQLSVTASRSFLHQRPLVACLVNHITAPPQFSSDRASLILSDSTATARRTRDHTCIYLIHKT